MNFYAYIFTNHRFRRDIILLLRSILRPCACIKKRRESKKKPPKRKNEILYHHYRLPQTTPSSNTSKLIGLYQRPPDIRHSNPHIYSRQQNLQTSDMIYNKQNTLLATLTPSQSSDKLRNRARV